MWREVLEIPHAELAEVDTVDGSAAANCPAAMAQHEVEPKWVVARSIPTPAIPRGSPGRHRK
jgi:hypothetical protein